MRAREFIVEYDRGITLRTTEQKLVARIANDSSAPDTVDEVMELIEGVDPTPQNTYTPWLVNQYIKNSFNISDLESVKDILSKYLAVKKHLPSHDIGQLSLKQIADMTITGEAKQAAPLEVVPDTEVLYNGPEGQLAIPKTTEASIALGDGTVWCTAWGFRNARPNQFNEYNNTGDLYTWRDATRKDKKYQFYWGDNIQFKDRANDTLSEKDMKYFREINPITAPIFAREEKKILNSGDADKITRLVSVLRDSGVRLKITTEVIANTPKFAYKYAINIVKGRWPEGEVAIATDPSWACEYAINVINLNNDGRGIRWPEGEVAIATDPCWAYEYAIKVINLNNDGKKIRWPEGEVAIATDPSWAYYYAKDVIKERWPEAEKIIASDASWAKKYDSMFGTNLSQQ